VTAGQVHESRLLEAAVGAVRLRRPGRGRPRTRPAAVAGDKGYSHPRIRRYLAARGIRAVIPRRSDQRPGDGRVRFDREAYRRRNVVERCVGRLREYRRVGTRYEKLAASYLAVVQVACIRDWLRRLTRPLSDTP
jgi:transposase